MRSEPIGVRSADRASCTDRRVPGCARASADAVKSPYYQAVRQRSSTLRYVLADLTKSPAGAAIYAALAELERLATLLPLAPSLADRMGVAEVIAQRHGRYRELLDRFGEAGDPRPAMAAAAPALDDARRRVESTDWWEALAATLLGAALTDELFEILVGGPIGAAAAAAAEPERIGEASAGVDANADEEWAARRLRAALAEDAVLAARIAMWGRRLVGEAIVLAREFGGERYPELADKLAVSHARRLEDLGLAG